jgi:hypothetical protein
MHSPDARESHKSNTSQVMQQNAQSREPSKKTIPDFHFVNIIIIITTVSLQNTTNKY